MASFVDVEQSVRPAGCRDTSGHSLNNIMRVGNITANKSGCARGKVWHPSWPRRRCALPVRVAAMPSSPMWCRCAAHATEIGPCENRETWPGRAPPDSLVHWTTLRKNTSPCPPRRRRATWRELHTQHAAVLEQRLVDQPSDPVVQPFCQPSDVMKGKIRSQGQLAHTWSCKAKPHRHAAWSGHTSHDPLSYVSSGELELGLCTG